MLTLQLLMLLGCKPTRSADPESATSDSGLPATLPIDGCPTWLVDCDEVASAAGDGFDLGCDTGALAEHELLWMWVQDPSDIAWVENLVGVGSIHAVCGESNRGLEVVDWLDQDDAESGWLRAGLR